MKTDINFSYLVFLSVVAALGGFLFGYDAAVISGTISQVTTQFRLDQIQTGWFVGCALVGSIIGVLFAGKLSDRYGRKITMLIAALFFSVSGIGCAFAGGFDQLVVARVLGGVGIGVVSIVSPLYISEVSIARYRGRLVSLYQLAVTLGFLGAYLANYQLLHFSQSGASLGSGWMNTILVSEVWRGMLGFSCVPSLLFFLVVLFIPESPRWLAAKQRMEQAQKVLTTIGGKEYAAAELESYRKSSSSEGHGGKGALSLLFSSKMRNVLIIGIVVAMFQQWSGTNVIFNYAQEIFQAAGYGISDVLMNIVVTGIANLVFTFVAIYTVDRLGRKTLMLIGSIGLAGIYTLLGLSYFFHFTGFVMIVFVVLAIGFYAMSLGPVTWVLLSEIFPNRVRGVAMAVCTAALWIASFLLTYTFPFLNSGLGTGGTFLLYAVICSLGFVFVLRRIPETKGKSLEELEKELVK